MACVREMLMRASTPCSYMFLFGSRRTQENMRNSRKSLKVLQRASTDKENLVGRQTIGPQKTFIKSKS